MKQTLVIIFSLLGLFSALHAGDYDELQKLVASDREQSDEFGVAVSISGNYAIVGAIGESHDVAGANYSKGAGSAYIFSYDGRTWSQEAKLVASDRAEADHFGISVSISGDYAIVGASYEDEDALGDSTLSLAGSAYIFKRDGSTWTQQQKIVASDRSLGDAFGGRVFISGDYAVVGVPWEDHDAAGDNEMNSAGSVYVFKREGTVWTQQQKIVPLDRAVEDYFGTSVSLSDNHLIVGAYTDDDESSSSAYNDAGSAYIFSFDGTSWNQEAKLIAPHQYYQDRFGGSVFISGDYAVVGSYQHEFNTLEEDEMVNAGAVYVFERSGSSWPLKQKLTASDRAEFDYFGLSISISGDYVLVGAYYEDEDASGGNSMGKAGSAYVFKREEGNWNEVKKLVASDRQELDNFGYSVALTNGFALVGAFQENEDAEGNNTMSKAGSAYIFDMPSEALLLPAELNITSGKLSNDFGIAAEGENPDSNTYSFTIQNSGQDTLIGTVNTPAGWLTISPDTGFSLTADETQIFTVTASTSELNPDSYSDTLFISSNGGDTTGIALVIVDSAPELTFINGSLSHDFGIVFEGEAPDTSFYAFTLKNTGGGVLTGSINETADWLSISPDSGFTLSANEILEYTITASLDYLPQGTHSAVISCLSNDRNISDSVIVLVEPGAAITDIPATFALLQNYPNPFNPSTTIAYQLSSDCDVELSIYDMNGKKVVTLLNENTSAGYYEVSWNAADHASGIYFCKLTAGNAVMTKKMVLMK